MHLSKLYNFFTHTASVYKQRNRRQDFFLASSFIAAAASFGAADAPAPFFLNAETAEFTLTAVVTAETAAAAPRFGLSMALSSLNSILPDLSGSLASKSASISAVGMSKPRAGIALRNSFLDTLPSLSSSHSRKRSMTRAAFLERARRSCSGIGRAPGAISITSPLSAPVVFSLLLRFARSSLCETGDLGRVVGLELCVDGGSEGGCGAVRIASSLARSSAMVVCPLAASSPLSAASP